MLILILGLVIISSVLAIILGIPYVAFYIHKKIEMRETINTKDITITSSTEWYYGHGQSVHGPISFHQLYRLYCQGTITAKTLMWTKEQEAWTPLGQLRCYHKIRHLRICQKLFFSLLIGCSILLIVIGFIVYYLIRL